MPVSQVAMTSRRLDSNLIVILYDNVAARRPYINVMASKATTAKKKTDANMPVSKMATPT